MGLIYKEMDFVVSFLLIFAIVSSINRRRFAMGLFVMGSILCFGVYNYVIPMLP